VNATSELPELDVARCTGCGDCVAVCPADCLALVGPCPWLPRPGDCVSCGACELICPAEAIRLQSSEPEHR
jgi:formate hydrogenlyase subunit 6/NADH:ubiquinone oxidoreductase subunit I